MKFELKKIVAIKDLRGKGLFRIVPETWTISLKCHLRTLFKASNFLLGLRSCQISSKEEGGLRPENKLGTPAKFPPKANFSLRLFKPANHRRLVICLTMIKNYIHYWVIDDWSWIHNGRELIRKYKKWRDIDRTIIK